MADCPGAVVGAGGGLWHNKSMITNIILPTRPQPDTIVAIFLLKLFGRDRFPGVDTALVTVDPKAVADPAKLLLDVGGGEFDHHGTDKCASEIVADKLGVLKNPELRQMIAYARRDDTKGQGIISKDPIDRTFGLSGLIASVNKQFPNDANQVVNIIIPLLDAQYRNAFEHYVALPAEIERLRQSDEFTTETLQTPIKNLKIAFLTSDHVGVPGYLRSNTGGNFRVVVQRRSTGHVNIMTKQNPKLDLSYLAGLIRMAEVDASGITVTDPQTMHDTGTHDNVPNWYYDPMTNSILNGGVSPDAIAPTAIEWQILQEIVTVAIEQSDQPV